MKPGLRIFLKLVLTVAVIGVAAAALLVYQYGRFLATPVAVQVDVLIEKGWSLQQAAATLEREGVITSARGLVVLGRLAPGEPIKAGEYRFLPGETPEVILERLRRGDVRKYKLVIPEGKTVKEVGALMAEAGWKEAPALLAAPDLILKLGLDAPALEGYLFPETYVYTQGDTALELVTRMLDEAREVLAAEWRERPESFPLTFQETLVLASIIEKETGLAGERPVIASVFHNRLKRRMPLQSDPTVIYGIADFDGNITRAHLEAETPYNTYRIPGLPPTPICNPGRASFHAALHPDQTPYLYFVANSDGSGGHLFSTTLKEHNRNVDQHQRRRSGKR